MPKEIYSLLAASALPVSISSASSIQLTGPVINNEDGKTGRIYIEAHGFGTVTSGLTPYLYLSHNGTSWIQDTTLPTFTTAGGYVFNHDNLGRYIRIGYTYGGVSISDVRIMLEIDPNYF